VRRSVLAFEGSYPAVRASALSGVPESTVYEWARKNVVVPSVSAEREKLWSYADLMALRIVYWLRHPKQADMSEIPRSPMPQVRRALARLDKEQLDIWNPNSPIGSPLLVDALGRIFIATLDNKVINNRGEGLLDAWLDLLGPFTSNGARGPDLRKPRPDLRIVPGKCAGEPHLVGSRVTTLSIKALADRGFDNDSIARLYPDLDHDALRQAVDFEEELSAAVIAA
jgi:uncharacterized protein (DUF433 family)